MCSASSGSHVSVHSHSASLEIVSVHGDDDDDTATAGEEDAPQLEKRMHLTWMTKKFCHKVLCHCPIFLPPMMRMLARL